MAPCRGRLLSVAGTAPFAHPIYDPLRPWLDRLALPDWPGYPVLDLLAAEAGARTALGNPIRFVAPEASDPYYEIQVYETGRVQTREQSWHDLFNALAWMAYPRTKAAINARHADRIPLDGPRRGRLRDLLTLFDEGGAIVACSDRELIALAREMRWRELFRDKRERVARAMRIFVIGHAVLDKAREPWPGITCKVIFAGTDAETLRQPPASIVEWVDTCASGWLAALADGASPRELAPLPIFGYPGWFADSENAGFYDDTRFFRPFRRNPPKNQKTARERREA